MSSNGCGLGGPSGVSLVSLGSPVPSARGSLRRKPIPPPRNNTLKKPEGKGKSDRDSQVRDRTRSEHKGRRELSRSISDVQNIPVLCASLFLPRQLQTTAHFSILFPSLPDRGSRRSLDRAVAAVILIHECVCSRPSSSLLPTFYRSKQRSIRSCECES